MEVEALLSTIQRQWGYKALHLANATRLAPAFRTGLAELDELLIGGMLVGRFSEFAGLPGSGVTASTYQAMAAAQQDHQLVAFLDCSETFDPDYAQACGINQDDLLLIRPENLQQTAAILRDLLAFLPLGLLVINGRMLNSKEASVLQTLLRKVVRLIPTSRSAVLLLSPYARSTSSPVHVRVWFEHQGWCIECHTLTGHQVTAELLKHLSSPIGQQTTFTIPMKWSIP
jgi:hypothetical protein